MYIFPHAISIKIFDLSTLYTTTPHSCQHGDILHNTSKQIFIIYLSVSHLFKKKIQNNMYKCINKIVTNVKKYCTK